MNIFISDSKGSRGSKAKLYDAANYLFVARSESRGSKVKLNFKANSFFNLKGK